MNRRANRYSAELRSVAVDSGSDAAYSRSGLLSSMVDGDTASAAVSWSDVGARSHPVPMTTVDKVLESYCACGAQVAVEGDTLEELRGATGHGLIESIQLESNEMFASFGVRHELDA